MIAMHQLLFADPAHGVSLRTSHAFLLLAVVVCCWHGARQLRVLDPIGWRRARSGFLLLAVAPWIGGHLHFLINNWSFALAKPAWIFFPWTGLHAGGAVIGLALSLPLVLRRYALPVGRIADALVPTIGIGIILGRLGCFAEGCCFGRVCAWPWCIAFPKGPYIYEFHLSQGYITPAATHSAPVHPLQLYFAAVGAVLIALSYWLQPRRRYAGQVALAALMVFSIGAAALEVIRDDYYPRVYWGPLPQLQWTALAMTMVSTVALAVAERRS